MSRLHFISGEKGGVGKSFTARVLAQYYIDRKMPFVGYDSDQSHATFTRFYAEYTSPVAVDDLESLDQLLVQAEDAPETDIIVDLAAQTSKHLESWYESSDLFDFLMDIDAKAYFWHVMDDGADSARLLDQLVTTLGNANITIVVVKNLGRASDFSFFDQSEIANRARDAGAICITLPRLMAKLSQKIDFYNFSFWAARNNTKAMSAIERKRAEKWLQGCYREMAPVFAADSQADKADVVP